MSDVQVTFDSSFTFSATMDTVFTNVVMVMSHTQCFNNGHSTNFNNCHLTLRGGNAGGEFNLTLVNTTLVAPWVTIDAAVLQLDALSVVNATAMGTYPSAEARIDGKNGGGGGHGGRGGCGCSANTNACPVGAVRGESWGSILTSVSAAVASQGEPGGSAAADALGGGVIYLVASQAMAMSGQLLAEGGRSSSSSSAVDLRSAAAGGAVSAAAAEAGAPTGGGAGGSVTLIVAGGLGQISGSGTISVRGGSGVRGR